MARLFRNAPLELLAPAGSLSILKELVDSGADAFYVGGKQLNMRLHRKDLNFTSGDLLEASAMCGDSGLRLYITVNKLLGSEDVRELEPYLEFLAARVHPDAILVQDMAVAALVRRLGLPLEMHASVMMNIHNEVGARALKDLGFSRFVLSRESSLNDARRIREAVGIEIEYFVHGDMCVAHGSQCLYSGVVFGLSGNRGLCMKPCRWPFSARLDGKEYETGFPLAVRDMCMHGYIPELVAAGVGSFKIEGRMRDATYLRHLITLYSDALDRFIADPDHYDRTIGADELAAERKRDFTTAFAFGNPGPDILNKRWEGTGKFYSTGKVFSIAKAEVQGTAERETALRETLRRVRKGRHGATQLAVRVDSVSQAKVALDSGADVVIFSGEPFFPNRLPGQIELSALREGYPGKIVALCLPRMMGQADYAFWTERLTMLAGTFDELYVGHLGADVALKALSPKMLGDSSLNVYNGMAADFWMKRGLTSLCVSLELGLTDLCSLLASGHPLEVIVHGRPTIMYMDNDAYQNAPRGPHRQVMASDLFPETILRLVDAAGISHPILKDFSGRNHLLPTKALRLIGIIPELVAAGVGRVRIESALYPDEDLRAIVAGYRGAVDAAVFGEASSVASLPDERAGWGFGALSFN